MVTLPAGRAKVFTEIEHAAAAKELGLDMRPRTVAVFGIRSSNARHGQGAIAGAINVPPILFRVERIQACRP